MIISPTKRKQLLEFLMDRWTNLISASVVELIHATECQIAKSNNLSDPEVPILVVSQPCHQIEIIKHRIVQILPEAKFIKYCYEPPMPLSAKDFIEVYTNEHKQCVGKVKELMERLQVT